MHYYNFNIGDYASHTRHLSELEDLAYRRLLDLYYLHEQPLNECPTTVARLINMRKHEKDVQAVLEEFFSLVTGLGWVNTRADQEIEKYHGKIESASKAGKASAQRRLNKRSTDVQLNKKQETGNIKQDKEKEQKEKEPVADAPVRLLKEVEHDEPAKPATRKRAGANGEDPNFARFWAAYDYAVGRHKALKSWMTIAPDQELADRIIAAATLYSSCNPSKTYYKHATTWLNNRHWEDDPNAIKPKIAQQANGFMTAAEKARRAVGLTIFGNVEVEHGRQREIIDITPPPAGFLGSEDI